MEKIKQAIARARQANNALHVATPLESDVVAPSSASARPAKSDVAPAAERAVSLDNLNYQQTTVVPIRADHLERNRIVSYNKNSLQGWAFDLLRTQVLAIMEENGWRTLAITSPTPEAGKSVIAINLAMSIAHHTTKTALLVDFDLRRPRIGAYLGLPMEKSLNDYLEGKAELQQAMVNPELPRLVVLPTRRPVPNSTETLSSPKVADLIIDLRDRYDSRIVIFDLPPLLTTDDAIAVLPKIDCVLLVVGNGLSSKKEIEDSLHHLPKANLIGTVLNKAETETRSYNYY